MQDDTPPPPPSRFTVDFAGLTLLGIYAVHEKIAEGAMGSVYLGEDTNLGRRVVVKVPHVRFLGEAGFRERFGREVSELVRLEHPHIVRILAQGEHEEVPFFVLQFLGGGSLETRLEADAAGRLPVEQAVHWFRTIARTLDFVHERGTIHRDVKPANILFDEVGNVYLSDFGVAKVLGADEANLTEAGTGIGSPRYMAPEQAYGRELTPVADQYALASTFYEAVSGRPPFSEGSAVEVLMKKANEAPPPPSTLGVDLPEAAEAALLKALHKDPAERFGSCGAFIETVARGVGLGTGEVALPPAAMPPRPRRGRLVGALVLLAALAGGILLWDRSRAPAAPTPPRHASRGELARVVLIEPGAEPRAPLRYRPTTGAVQRFEHRLEMVMHMTTEGEEAQSLPSAPMVSKGEIHVVDAEDPQHITYAWSFSGMEYEASASISDAQREALREGLKPLLGRSFESVITDVGGHPEPPDASDQVSQLMQVVRASSAALPEEPVGVGARWEYSDVAQQMGLRVVQTVTYELVARDGDRITLRSNVAQTAAEQEFSGTLAGLGTLDSLHSAGSGMIVVDLTRLAPLKLDVSIKGQIDLTQTMGEEPMSARMNMEVHHDLVDPDRHGTAPDGP